jgi:hypothetical protein
MQGYDMVACDRVGEDGDSLQPPPVAQHVSTAVHTVVVGKRAATAAVAYVPAELRERRVEALLRVELQAPDVAAGCAHHFV